MSGESAKKYFTDLQIPKMAKIKQRVTGHLDNW